MNNFSASSSYSNASTNIIPSSGWTCTTCQQWVPTGQWHFCNNFNNYFQVWGPVWPAPVVITKTAAEELQHAVRVLEMAVDRLATEQHVCEEIAKALERIQAKLERKP